MKILRQFSFNRLFVKRLCYGVLVVFVAMVAWLTLLRGSVYWLNTHPEKVQVFATQFLKQPLQFQSLKASSRGFSIHIMLRNLVIMNDEKTRTWISVHRLLFGINPIKNLMRLSPWPQKIRVSGLQIQLERNAKDQWLLNGELISSSGQTPHFDSLRSFLTVLYRIQSFEIKKMELSIKDVDWPEMHLHNIEGRWQNRYRYHKFSGRVASLESQPHAKLKWEGEWYGHPGLEKEWRGDLKIHVQSVNWQSWLEKFVLGNFKFQKGQGDLLLNLRWEDSRLKQIDSDADLHGVQLKEFGMDGPLILDYLRGQFSWSAYDRGWQVRAKSFEGKLANMEEALTMPWRLSMHQSEKAGTDNYHLTVDFLSLKQLSRLLKLSNRLSDVQEQQLTKMNPRGDLRQLIVRWVQPTDYTDPEKSMPTDFNWEVMTQFSKVHSRPFQHYPGVENLAGSLRFNAHSGRLVLKAAKTVLDIPTLFRAPWALEKLATQMQWRKRSDHWDLDVSEWVLNTRTIEFKGRSQLSIPFQGQKGSPVLDLEGYFQGRRIQGISEFLPAKVMNPKLVQWLDRAIVQAERASGRVIFKGAFADFPFDKDQGLFTVNASVKNGTLDYWKDWPKLEEVSASLLFRDRSMQVDVEKAKILGAEVERARAYIPRMSQDVTDWLYIKGAVKGDARQGLYFVRTAPVLKERLGKALTPVEMEGSMGLDLNLNIPISRAEVPITLSGKVILPEAVLRIPNWKTQFDKLSGSFSFTQDDVASDGMTARWLDQPVKISIGTRGKSASDRVTEIRMDSEWVLEALQKSYAADFSKYATGKTPVQATFDIPHAVGKPVQLHLVSDLDGVALKLPQPFGKAINQRQTLKATVTPVNGNQIQIQAQLPPKGSVALNLQRAAANSPWKIQRGNLRLGQGQADLPKNAGLILTGTLPELPKDMSLTQNGKKPTQPFDPMTLFSAFDLTIGRLDMGGQILTNARVQLQSEGNTWRVNVTHPNVSGSIVLSKSGGRQPIVAQFSRLYLSPGTSTREALAPQKVPALRASVADFRYDNKPYGQVNVTLTPQSGGVRIQQLQANSGFFNLNAQGSWTGSSAQSAQTRLSGRILIPRLSRALSSWGMPAVVDSQRTDVNFNLSWAGSPQSFSLARATGSADLSIRQGVIMQLDPGTEAKIGIGKLLSILSLQTLPRYLTLDFSNLTQKGFTFDSLKGRLELSRGNAYTRDTRVRGSIANIDLQGRIGLAQKDYDVLLTISPRVTATIPIVATIAGGPVVGAAAWVVEQVLGDKVSRITSYTYRLQGPWVAPRIQESIKR